MQARDGVPQQLRLPIGVCGADARGWAVRGGGGEPSEQPRSDQSELSALVPGQHRRYDNVLSLLQTGVTRCPK